MTDKLWRRIWNALGFGQIQVTDDTGPVLRGQVRLNALETRDNTPIVQQFGLAANPPAGSDAVLVFLAGDRSNGVAVATNHQPTRPRNQAPGEVTVFNAHGMTIALTAGGIVINGGGKPLTISNVPTITADVDLLRVRGDLIDNYPTNANTAADFRDNIYNPHTHPDAQGGITGTPTPQA